MAKRINRDRLLFQLFTAVGHAFLVLLLLLCAYLPGISQENPLEKKLTIASNRVTIYEALNLISDRIGYNFVYDSKDLESDRKVKVEAKDEPVGSVLSQLLANSNLKVRVLDKYILLYKDEAVRSGAVAEAKVDSIQPCAIKGRIFDKDTKMPIPFATVGVAQLGIGTVSNMDGYFHLKIPATQLVSSIAVAHLGYKSQSLPVELLSGQQVDIYLESYSISIQEVIIRNIDPVALIQRTMAQRGHVFGDSPVYLTTFYREGIEKSKDIVNYSEAVFKVYKSPYTRSPEMDQVKLLKSRKVKNEDQRDTLWVKMKAGINASLDLDIVKSVPDFLDREFMSNYHYLKTDIVTLDSLKAYAISFEQRSDIAEPLFKGIIYITMDSLAVLGADFEINPEHVADFGSRLVVRKSRGVKVVPTKVAYSVRYKLWNGRYYLNHIRGDLDLKVKRRSRLFANSYHVFLEMAVIQIDADNVVRFARDERIKSNVVFNDLDFTYDDNFWREFNVITPELNLQELLRKIAPKIETIEGVD